MPRKWDLFIVNWVTPLDQTRCCSLYFSFYLKVSKIEKTKHTSAYAFFFIIENIIIYSYKRRYRSFDFFCQFQFSLESLSTLFAFDFSWKSFLRAALVISYMPLIQSMKFVKHSMLVDVVIDYDDSSQLITSSSYFGKTILLRS